LVASLRQASKDLWQEFLNTCKDPKETIVQWLPSKDPLQLVLINTKVNSSSNNNKTVGTNLDQQTTEADSYG